MSIDPNSRRYLVTVSNYETAHDQLNDNNNSNKNEGKKLTQEEHNIEILST